MESALSGLIDIVFMVLDRLLGLFSFVVLVWVIVSWLISFGVINAYNRVVHLIAGFLDRATRWALNPIRNALPDLGPIDVSPLVLLFMIWVARMVLLRVLYPAVFDLAG